MFWQPVKFCIHLVHETGRKICEKNRIIFVSNCRESSRSQRRNIRPLNAALNQHHYYYAPSAPVEISASRAIWPREPRTEQLFASRFMSVRSTTVREARAARDHRSANERMSERVHSTRSNKIQHVLGIRKHTIRTSSFLFFFVLLVSLSLSLSPTYSCQESLCPS